MNSKTTKRALLSSVVAMLVCFTMLLSTTFAWFTDTAVSASNKIVAGSLKIDLEVLKDGTWTSIKGSKAPIFDYDKWEPGYTDVKVLKVENEGTLALKWVAKFVSATPLSDLANVIDVYVLPSATELSVPADRNLDGYTKVGTVAQFVNSIEDTTKGVLKADEVAYLGIALKMQEDAGNEYQEKSLGGAFDITIFATQETFEKDTFDDQYDVNAAFSVWDGTVPAEMPASLVVDGTTQTVHVKDAAAFAYLSTLSADWVDLYTDGNGTDYSNYKNGAGANYYYSGQWTVSLEADIDLNNHVITPVDIVFGQSTGNTAFKGNNYTIRNINTTTGLFANGTRANFSDLTLENVKATNGALSGSASSTVTNVTVKNAAISGVDYVGGLVGKTYSSIYDCRVVDSSVIATGKEAGGLVGYAETNSKGSTISGNTVKNVSVYANNRAAGLVAQPNVNIKVYNNTVDTVTVGAEDVSSYQPGAIASNALDAANVYDNTVINADVMTSAVEIASNAAELATALSEGEKVVLADDIVMDSSVSLSNADFVLEGAGHTITMADGATNTYALFDITGGKATIKNVTFDGIKDGAIVRTVGVEFNADNVTAVNGNHTQVQGLFRLMGKSTIENCTFKNNVCNMVISLNYDGANNDPQVVKNCVFEENTCNATAVVYYVKGASATIDGNKFVGNNVTVTGTSNAATLYMGFQENTTITNNVFENNTVNGGTSKRVAGAIMIGYDAVITGNSFVGNKVTGENAKANDVAAAAYYTDIDLSGNYWGGSAPVENDDYYNEYPDNHSVIINDYLTTYGN